MPHVVGHHPPAWPVSQPADDLRKADLRHPLGDPHAGAGVPSAAIRPSAQAKRAWISRRVGSTLSAI
ncbi:MAG TPA: hypothetical protein VJT72_08850, partial [Pseudonocardiaceae bacterium]|nr:hypothetical protein [Pseudonocardiaceae bacterium]